MVRRIVMTFRQAGVFPIVVVSEGGDKELRRQLAGLGVIFLRIGADADLFGFAKAGLSFLAGKCEKAVFSPVNVPAFTSATLGALMRTPAAVACPSLEGRSGHPVVIAREAMDEVLSYHGPDGLRGALATLGDRRAWVSVGDRGVVTSVRDEQDLLSLVPQHNCALIHPAIHLELEGETPFLDDRCKLLLYLIDGTHNIRVCCELTATSYSKAWGMINHLEDVLGYAVVERHHGGRDGGGTLLTERGRQLLGAYLELECAVRERAQAEFDRLFVRTGLL
ncbi:hypothetical protein HMPREF2826_03600 [Olsenella sp. HMSC062G07]|nr:hypothetical protein HMPREF2826_03600 [Olsenella sp. HMSC062G07]